MSRLCRQDVPSPASEFAHPDVVIGFTILAYRYEGMRRSDFKKVVADLVDQLDLQVGPILVMNSSSLIPLITRERP